MTKNFLLPGALWGVFLLFVSCAQTPDVDPDKHPEEGSYRTTLVTGRFEGYEDYRDWVVYLTGFNYKSVTYRVEPDGSFHIKATNIPKGKYRLVFGRARSRNLGSMNVWVESTRTHLGVIHRGG